MKHITSLFAAIVMVLLLMLNVSGSSKRTVQVILNGEPVVFDTAAYIDNNRTMVPLRGVAEALGLTVNWHDSSNTVYLSDGTWTPKLDGTTIVVDPGHGGSATGAVYSGVRESDLNLAIAKKAAKALEALGAKVVMTRSDDRDLTLTQRTDLANRLKADLFLSVHCNVSPTNSKATGIYTAYHGSSRQSLALADLLRQTMMQSTGAADMGTHDRSDLSVLRTSRMPAALVECGFMSTPEELKLLQQEDYQQLLAQGIAQGAALYLAQ